MEYVTAGDARIPALGLGTYKLRGQECTETVKRALELGYRHVDTAEYYGNQEAIGRALAEADVDREELFLVTKVWKTNLGYEDTLESARESRERLGVDSVDLLLIHRPSQTIPTAETIDAMNALQAEGTVKHVGVSNFTVSQLREAVAASETPIVTNQVEYHPYTSQADLLEYCIENDVVLTAYSPLAQGKVTDEETLAEIGERYDKSAAQAALRWLLQQEKVAAIPKAGSPEHLRANIDVFDFDLTAEEVERVFDLQGGLVDRVRAALGL